MAHVFTNSPLCPKETFAYAVLEAESFLGRNPSLQISLYNDFEWLQNKINSAIQGIYKYPDSHFH